MSEAMAREWELAKRHLPRERIFIVLRSSKRSVKDTPLTDGQKRFVRATAIPPRIEQRFADLVLRFEPGDWISTHPVQQLREVLVNAGMVLHPATWSERHPWIFAFVFLGVLVFCGLLAIRIWLFLFELIYR